MDEQAKNLNQALLEAMDAYANRTCFQVKRGNRYQNVPYWRFKTLVFHLAHFFRQQGLAPGERVALAADNSPEWMVAYSPACWRGESLSRCEPL